MRTLLTLLALALIVVLAVQIWRSRFRPTGGLDRFPEPPKELSGPAGAAVLPAVEGVYLGTCMAGDWRDRVTVGDVGQRSTAMLYLSRSGLLIDRISASPLWIPAGSVRGARTGRVLVGRPVGGADLLVTWQLGGRLLDSVFRADNGEVYPQWLSELRAIAGGGNGAMA
jgi:hypothetical protein